jgi:hypothetical protein
VPCIDRSRLTRPGKHSPDQGNTCSSTWIACALFWEIPPAAGAHNIQISFNLSSGNSVVFDLPQVCSVQGTSNFHYSDLYTPDTIDGSMAHVFATWVGDAPYDVPAGVYSLILEAHDLAC